MPCPEIREKPLVDVSSWVRIGGSWGKQIREGSLGMGTPAPPGEQGFAFDVGFATAIGADATIGLGKESRLHLGPWGEIAVTDLDTLTTSGGAEIQIGSLPKKLELFHYPGEGQLTARVGVGRTIGSSLPRATVVVSAITFGYLAPWDLKAHRRQTARDMPNCEEGPSGLSGRYMIGARLVASLTRSLDDPQFWLATVGLEFEPAGAIRYIFGIRDWY